VDAANALKRLQEVLEAEVVAEVQIIDPSLPVTIELRDASFTLDSSPPDTASKKKKGKGASKNGKH
jgi:hypothetical protein